MASCLHLILRLNLPQMVLQRVFAQLLNVWCTFQHDPMSIRSKVSYSMQAVQLCRLQTSNCKGQQMCLYALQTVTAVQMLA